MESLSSDKILEFNPDTLYFIRKAVDLDKPGRIDEAINLLNEWVKKQSHFMKKDFSREYLERLIIASKGSVERAKSRLDKLCTLKTLMPNFFTKCNVKTDFNNMDVVASFAFLPKLTNDHNRVFLSRPNTVNFDSQYLLNYYRVLAILCEYLKLHDYSNGTIVIIDFFDLNILEVVSKINVVDLHQAVTLFVEGYSMRIKGIYLLTQSKMIDALVSMFKKILSPKMASRIYIHKSIDSIDNIVPMNIFPSEYGGEGRSLSEMQHQWMNIVGSDDFVEYLKEMNKATINESYRQTDNFNEQYLGTPGSFRTFKVD